MTAVRPNFDHPPVIEQAITLMFAPIDGFTVGDIGMFWDKLRAEFPICEAMPRLKPSMETFGSELTVQLSFSGAVEVPRAFFRSKEQHELVQLQSDRFTYNWMRSPTSEYPRHQRTIGRFWELYDSLQSYLAERGLPEPKLQQCELINVNIAPLKQFGGSYASALKIFSLIENVPMWPERIELEAATIQTHYVLKNDAGEAIGRLHFEANPVRDNLSGEEAIRFDLVARGSPAPLDRRSAEHFFSEARDYINTAFLRLTTDEARRAWGERP